MVLSARFCDVDKVLGGMPKASPSNCLCDMLGYSTALAKCLSLKNGNGFVKREGELRTRSARKRQADSTREKTISLSQSAVSAPLAVELRSVREQVTRAPPFMILSKIGYRTLWSQSYSSFCAAAAFVPSELFAQEAPRQLPKSASACTAMAFGS